ncbi:hypothetical protein CJ030_MR2G012430 [Morella rubra]|uniref:DUF1421 domain-containing protein n=1 Tax=Morella rubra TaxID=262757 RepID=A0A6A1WF00_9ROSI|nr:hypothetical protein CJ030_MR2G012430 [Morella rubra]
MRPSEFMDKQIMELSRSRSEEFSAASPSPQDDEDNDDLSPVFRFHPIRTVVSPPSHASSIDFGRTGDSGNYGATLISVIDRMMKELSENLVHAVEGLSARLTQLETRTRQLENSIDELKDAVEFNQSNSDRKLSELEIMLKEVQGGIQDLRDKQEIAEARKQLAKLKMSKEEQQSEKQNRNIPSNSVQGLFSSVPQQRQQSLPIPVASPQQLPAPHYNVLPNLPLQNTSQTITSLATSVQLPTQLLQNQIPSHPLPESYYSSPVLTPQSTHQQYRMPPMHQSQQPSPAQHQHYHPASLHGPITQLPQPPHGVPPPLCFVNPQAHCPSTQQPPSSAPPTQQVYFGSGQHMHLDQPPSSPYSRSPSGHSTFYEHSHSGSPPRYSSSALKPSQLSNSPSVLGGGSSNARLPVAQVLPYALPMAASVGDAGSGSGGTGDRIPTDDVVDNVVAMGFRRDVVRATVRKLTETGQSVDLNMVLDVLMNNGAAEPQSGRFGR